MDGDVLAAGSSRVAVKMLRDRPTIPMSRSFIREASRVKHLNHVNVIRLLAVHFRTNPLLMVFEFMPLGDLKALLRTVGPSDVTGAAFETRLHLVVVFREQ